MNGIALILGVCLSFILTDLIKKKAQAWIHPLLKMSLIGIGFGLTLQDLSIVGIKNMCLIVFGIALTFMGGHLLTRQTRLRPDLALLITVGTAICGGSAVAAVSPVVKAKTEDVVCALSAIFLLNSVALFLFPVIGHLLGLSPSVFGVWAGIAIHDTSSVIGAAGMFGDGALKAAVVVKSMRILFIIPVVLLLSVKSSNREAGMKGIPWFLLLFVGAVAFNYFFPVFSPLCHLIYKGSKLLMSLPILILGTTFSLKTFQKSDAKAFGFAIAIWMLVSGASLALIYWA